MHNKLYKWADVNKILKTTFRVIYLYVSLLHGPSVNYLPINLKCRISFKYDTSSNYGNPLFLELQMLILSGYCVKTVIHWQIQGVPPVHAPQGSRFFSFDIQNFQNIATSGVGALVYEVGAPYRKSWIYHCYYLNKAFNFYSVTACNPPHPHKRPPLDPLPGSSPLLPPPLDPPLHPHGRDLCAPTCGCPTNSDPDPSSYQMI